jgi:hypothetical protein
MVGSDLGKSCRPEKAITIPISTWQNMGTQAAPSPMANTSLWRFFASLIAASLASLTSASAHIGSSSQLNHQAIKVTYKQQAANFINAAQTPGHRP